MKLSLVSSPKSLQWNFQRIVGRNTVRRKNSSTYRAPVHNQDLSHRKHTIFHPQVSKVSCAYPHFKAELPFQFTEWDAARTRVKAKLP